MNLDSSILSDKALGKNENEVAINLPADFVLEVPTKDEMCQMSDITENDHQKHIIKIRTELRNKVAWSKEAMSKKFNHLSIKPP